MSDKYYAYGNPLVKEYQYEIEDGKCTTIFLNS